MKNRITMNSKSLQEKFPEIYREFFSKCPIVISAPGNFFWTGAYSVLYGGLAIKQNLPLRVYVGLEPTNFSGFEIGKILTFIPQDSCFKPWAVSISLQKKLTKFLNQKFKNSQPNIKSGFKINAVFEVPSGRGHTALGAFSAALSGGVSLCSRLISPKEIAYWNQLPVYELSSDKNFDSVFRTAWKLDFLIRDGFSSGATVFTPLAHSAYPIVYFTEKNPTANLSNLDIIDQKKYFGFRIDELANLIGVNTIDLDKISEWPVDFGLIFSGDIRQTESVLKSVKEIEWYLADLLSEWKKILPKLDFPKDKFIFSKIVKSSQLKIGEPYLNALITNSLETFYNMIWILSYGSSKEAIGNFLRVINCGHKLLAPLFPPSQISEEICFLVDKYVRNLGDEFGAGCKLVVEQKGDILFVVNYHTLRDKIDDLITKLRKETGKDIWLDYASWLDGFEEEGVKVEQHLAEGIYSKFISEGSISLKSFTKDRTVQTELTSLEKFEKEMPKIDLLLDAIEGDVYIKGKKLTSKEIPSSSATIEILSILLENLGKSISNSKLPESSYSRDRNEMQSKIVSPLVKAVKKITKKNLSLKVTGGLVEFKIKLEPSDLNIKILNKIF